MSSSQNPLDRKDNKNSTPTSNLTPGEPLWNKRDHEQKSFGQGYDWHEPVSLMKGSVAKGNSLIRYGKFSFKRSMRTTGTAHGRIIDIPILRTEGSQGEFTLILTQKDPENESGVFGNFNTFVNHGYYYCNVDVDMVSLNTQQGVSFDAQNRVRVTFKSGETEKILKTIIPYRTRVGFLLPDVIRKKVTYWVQEYNNIRANNYRKPYKVTGQQNGGVDVSKTWNWAYSWSQSNDNQYNSRNIKNHWVWYKVYTLPMPISWIKSNVGNPIYIDRWDKNYQYRRVNNTCRLERMPNREDDDTLPDQLTDGYITRYDHQEKLDLVLGKTRFSRFNQRLGYRNVGWCYSSRTFVPDQIQGNKAHWWISNDTRITHRYFPEYAGYSSSYSQGSIGGGATMVGTLTFAPAQVESAFANNHTIAVHDDYSYNSWRYAGAGYGNFHAYNSPTSWTRDITKLQAKHLPMPYTGQTWDDFPADEVIQKAKETEGGTWNKNAYSSDSIHPETSIMMLGGGGGAGHDWGGPIPYKDQSWYESQRYVGGVDMDPVSKLTPAFNNYVNGTPHVFPTPVDREFKYGDPLTRIGNLAQPMFNHYGTKPDEYYQGMEQYVMNTEDPSEVKKSKDFPFYSMTETFKNRGDSRHHRYIYDRCWRWYCPACSSSGPSKRGGWGPVGWRGVNADIGDLTSQWVNAKTNATSAAGELFTEEDAPLSYDGKEYFEGYRYKGDDRGVDTTQGSRGAQVGFGSSGHGEQGTSRYLYDYRDITHPLSSYEMNDENLRGYYRCCTDHKDRQVTIVMEPEFPDPPYDLGETEILILINKGSKYDTFKAAEYDDTVLVDHTINPGNTFQLNDEWDSNPTGPSVTDRLFTSQGARSDNPVLFLGVSAGNYPGGSMESPDKIVLPSPSRSSLKGPDNGESFNGDKLVDTVSKSTHGVDGKTYTYTYHNRGQSPAKVNLGVSFQRQQGPYVPANPGATPPTQAEGDKIADWSFKIQDPYKPGDSNFPTNTFELSGGGTILVDYVVKPTTDTPTGYIIKQTVTIEESTGKFINKQLIFDVDVTA